MSSRTPSAPPSRLFLRLYIAGDTPSARRALDSRERLIAEIAGTLDIEVIDILERPEEAEAAAILATPTLSDDSVAPPRRLIGEISNIAMVLEYFGCGKQDINP